MEHEEIPQNKERMCKMNSKEINVVEVCLRISCHASTSAVRIYNLIRAVGRGELTADNALHQMIEEYINLKMISKESSELADYFEKKEGAK